MELNEELIAVLKSLRGKVTGDQGKLVEQILEKVEAARKETKLRTASKP